jgi:hypothetical protein
MNELYSALYTLILNGSIEDARVGSENSSISIKNFRNAHDINEQIRENNYTYLLIKLNAIAIKIDIAELSGDVQVVNDELRLYTEYEYGEDKKYVSIKLIKQTS